jgi:diaminopimelate decarboxylase
MNAIFRTIVGLTLAIAMLPAAHAGSKANVLINACKAEAATKFGVEERFLKLKQINNAGRKTRVWLRVNPADADKYTALCKINRKSKEVVSLEKL